jgi:PAS domain-containing protein
MKKASFAALSLTEAHRLLHKLHHRLADLERENAALKRKLKAVKIVSNKTSTASEALSNPNKQRDLLNRRRHPGLLRRIIDSVGDLIYVKDREGVYLACNTASENFIGIKESEQIEKLTSIFLTGNLLKQFAIRTGRF